MTARIDLEEELSELQWVRKTVKITQDDAEFLERNHITFSKLVRGAIIDLRRRHELAAKTGHGLTRGVEAYRDLDYDARTRPLSELAAAGKGQGS